MFEQGYLKGQWGILDVLHRAKDGDTLKILRFKKICEIEQPRLLNQTVIGPSRIRIASGSSYTISYQRDGELRLIGNQLLLTRTWRWGVDALPEAAGSDYFILSGSPSFETWADTKHMQLRLIEDKVNWNDFRKDISALIGAGLLIIPHPYARVAGATIVGAAIATDVLEAAEPVIISLLRGEVASPADLLRLTNVPALELAKSREPVGTVDDGLTVIRLVNNLRNAIEVTP